MVLSGSSQDTILLFNPWRAGGMGACNIYFRNPHISDVDNTFLNQIKQEAMKELVDHSHQQHNP